MTQRQAARNGTAGIEGSAGTDPYDNVLFMPLRQFVEEPIVKDLLHNGAALQVGQCIRLSYSISDPKASLQRSCSSVGSHNLPGHCSLSGE